MCNGDTEISVSPGNKMLENIEEIDVVELTEDVAGFVFPDSGQEAFVFKAGTVGTVISKFSENAYEVEINSLNDVYHTIVSVVCTRKQIKLITSYQKK